MVTSARSARPGLGRAAAWYTLAVLLVANAFNYLDRMIVGLLVEPIRHQFDLNDAQVGLLIGGTFALVFTFASIPIGRLVDQFDRRRIIAVGCLVWSLCAALLGFARSFVELLLGRMGVAVGEAALAPSAVSMIADAFPRSSMGRALAIYGVGAVAGSGLAFLGGAALLATVTAMPPLTLPGYGEVAAWQATLMLTGLLSLIVIPVVFTVREPARTGLLKGSGVSATATLRFLGDHLAYFLPHFFGFALLQMFVYALTSWVPAFLVRAHGMTPSEAGTAYGLVWLTAGVAGAIAGGILADWIARRRGLRSALWILAVASLCLWPLAALYPLVESTGLALALVGAMTFTTCLPVGLSNLLLQGIAPNQMRGQVVAITTFAVNLIAFGVGPTGVGLLSDWYGGGAEGLRAALAIVATVCCPIAALLFIAALRPFERLRRQAEGWS